jgi:hypothetical protein
MQACWLPTAAARGRARVGSCGIWGGPSGAGAGLLRVFRFPLPIFIPPISPQSPSSIIWGWYNRPVVAAVPSRLSLTPLTIIKKTQACRHNFGAFLLLLHLDFQFVGAKVRCSLTNRVTIFLERKSGLHFRKKRRTWQQLGVLLSLLYNPEDGGDTSIRNFGWLSMGYRALRPRQYNYSF